MVEVSRAPWFCPSCQKHHGPHVDTCPGTGIGTSPGFLPTPAKPVDDGMCDACRKGGVCGCYRPERDGFTVASAVTGSCVKVNPNSYPYAVTPTGAAGSAVRQ